MKKILLFRHGLPDFPGGKPVCIGQRTDLPLSAEGKAMGEAMQPLLESTRTERIFVSPLLRCRETALALSGGNIPMTVEPDLREMDSGAWDGYSFQEIAARWPELYAARERDPLLLPPEGESHADAAARGLAVLRRVAAETEGNIAVVAHAGINMSMICALTGGDYRKIRSIPQPYLCLNLLHFDGEKLSVSAVGVNAEEWRREMPLCAF